MTIAAGEMPATAYHRGVNQIAPQTLILWVLACVSTSVFGMKRQARIENVWTIQKKPT